MEAMFSVDLSLSVHPKVPNWEPLQPARWRRIILLA